MSAITIVYFITKYVVEMCQLVEFRIFYGFIDDSLPLQLDDGTCWPIGQAIIEANYVAQCSFTSRLLRRAAENGSVSSHRFQRLADRCQLDGRCMAV